MASIGFIGVGNMGGPMAINLAKAGHTVKAFDLSKEAVDKVTAAGCEAAETVTEAAREVDVVITMLPAGKHVSHVYEGTDGVFATAAPGTLMIDCSTIDVDTAVPLSPPPRTRGSSWWTPRFLGALVGPKQAR